MTKYTRYQCEKHAFSFKQPVQILISSRQLNILKTLSKTSSPTMTTTTAIINIIIILWGFWFGLINFGNATHKHNRNANENIQYLMPAEFSLESRSSCDLSQSVLSAPRKIPKKKRTKNNIKEIEEHTKKKDTKRNNSRRNEKKLWTNTCLYHYQCIWIRLCNVQKIYQITELFAFHVNTKQIKSNTQQCQFECVVSRIY